MKRFLSIWIGLLMLIVFSVPAFAVNYDYWAAVYKRTNVTKDTNLTNISSGIQFVVLSAGSDTAATLTKFGDNASTAVTNPITAANFASATVCAGIVKFRTTAATVDLIVTHNTGGFSTVVKGFTPYDHSIILDETVGVPHTGIIWFGGATAETSTSINFIYDTLITDVRVEVVTVTSGGTLDVGLLSSQTAGDADGFRDNVLMTTAGFISDTGVITNGTSADYTPVSTYGALLYTAVTGSDLTTSATLGGRSFIGHVVTASNASTLTWSAGSTTSAGYIYYTFQVMR